MKVLEHCLGLLKGLTSLAKIQPTQAIHKKTSLNDPLPAKQAHKRQSGGKSAAKPSAPCDEDLLLPSNLLLQLQKTLDRQLLQLNREG